jgi:PAP2 superfamily
VDAERALGLAFEPAAHAWAAGVPGLLGVLWTLYLFAHLPAVAGALVWAWLERPSAYRAARDVFLIAQAITLAGYVLVPAAPPRLLPELGMAAGAEPGEGLAGLLQSQYAALPSGHVVFALVAAGIVVALVRRPLVRAAAALYPPLVIAATILTANHFWLDAAAAAAVVALALTGRAAYARSAQRGLRRRPRRRRAWSRPLARRPPRTPPATPSPAAAGGGRSPSSGSGPRS